jgi:hypothetical protein
MTSAREQSLVTSIRKAALKVTAKALLSMTFATLVHG